MYCRPNFKTKKALKEAIGRGDHVTTFQPGGMFPGTLNGEDTIEGPWYPKPHTWYARVEIKGRVIVKVLG